MDYGALPKKDLVKGLINISKIKLTKLRKYTLSLIGLIIFLFIFYKLLVSWNEISSEIYALDFIRVVLSLLLLAIFFVLLSLGWSLIFRELNNQVTFERLMILYSKSQLIRYLPGGIWNYVGRVALLKELGIGYDIIIVSSIFEAIMLVLSGLIIGILFCYNIFNPIELLLLLFFIIVFLILLYKLKTLLNFFTILFKKTQFNFIDIQGKAKIKILVFYMMLWLFAFSGFSLFVSSLPKLSLTINLWNIGGTFLISWTFGFLSFMPGGLGTREASLVFLLSRAGIIQFSYFISVFSRILLVISEIMSFIIILVWASYKNKKFL